MALSNRVSQFNDLGKAYYANASITVPVSSVHYIAFRTIDAKCSIESITFAGQIGDSTITYHDAVSLILSGITGITHRMNRTISPTENASHATIEDSPSALNEGVEISRLQTFAVSGSGSNTSVNNVGGGSEFELIFNPQEIFLIKIDNTDSSNEAKLNVSITWIEETRKVI